VEEALLKAAEVLRRGGVVAFPTDTVWGLLALPHEPAAVEKVYRLKKRPRQKPLQLLVAEREKAQALAEADPRFLALAERFWPGALTLVAPARVPFPLIGARERVGIRLPAHPGLRELIRAVGGVVAATSLNESGRPPVRTFEEAKRFGADLTLAGPEPPGLASSVVVLPEGRVEREGAVPKELLLEVLAGR